MKYISVVIIITSQILWIPQALATDLLTLNCLIGYGDDKHEELCAVVDPKTKQGVIEAQKKWKERNKIALKDLNDACKTRLLRAYKNDEAQIESARKKAKEFRNIQHKKLLENPNRHNMINCRAYVEDFGSKNENTDIQPWLIKETQDSSAQPIDWSKISNE